MPRPNPPRSLQSEENLAHRIAYERERRGWTYEGTARRLTDAGCPIQGSAIYKIEKGNPRRRISVDELVAFTQVFDFENVSDLLIPLELVAEHEVLNLIGELEQKSQILAISTEDYTATLERVFRLASSMEQEQMLRILELLWNKAISVLSEAFCVSKKNNDELGNLITKIHDDRRMVEARRTIARQRNTSKSKEGGAGEDGKPDDKTGPGG